VKTEMPANDGEPVMNAPKRNQLKGAERRENG